MSNKRKISKETKIKILQCAANILAMHGSLVGDRICQDWSGEDYTKPSLLFSDEEIRDISFNYELHNSNGEDYDADFINMDDEMVASFTMSELILDIKYEL